MPRTPEQERNRTREKYHRLKYKDKHRGTTESRKAVEVKYKAKFPYKRRAKQCVRYHRKKGRIICPVGMQCHHWSYQDRHWLDVIFLTKDDHALLHRYLQFDEESRMYRNLDGVLLDEKEDHLFLLEQAKEEP